jgi:uncharacterized protein YndB with AHSA1/START domain
MADDRREVKREAVLDAPPRDVWEAVTDEALLSEWLADEVELEPEPGGHARFRFEDGSERAGTVLRVEEERRLSFTWARPGEAETEVDLVLEPLITGTRVVITERANFPVPVALFGAAWGTRLHALAGATSLALV